VGRPQSNKKVAFNPQSTIDTPIPHVSNPESHTVTNWIASSLTLLAMTVNCFADSARR
jgi:hypothetical protein